MGQEPSFGEQLRHFRERAGLTQEELAARAGLTAKAISSLERGRRRFPYPHTVHALANELGLDEARHAALLAALPRRGGGAVGTAERAADADPVGDPPARVAPAAAAPRWEPRIWFPQTKLRPPQVGGATLPRPTLLAEARAAILTHRVTLIAAPAGSGKTTLLAALPGALPGCPVAWLALDADDNDPTTFVSALVLALRAALPTLGGATEAVLDSLPEPGLQLRRLIGTLINDLVVAPVGPFVLVLDDLHAIGEAAIHAALDQLLERLPDDAHVVIATRYDPPLALARLRARGQLAELRLEALRFSPAETGALLNDRLALALPPGEVLLLHGRVEGWAAGLRLLALMLGRLSTAEERRALVTRLGEEGRYIFDFLAEEVLGQQEPELQRFLLDTSILPELAPALCRAVTGRDDAADLLDLAYRRNLFLTLGGADDGLGTTFRFHDLFAAFLRGRLQRESPERIRSLHGRAGDASADPARAIAHYCAAERWDEAARIIEERGADFARHGMYRRLHDWIVALPPDVREARPRLLHLLGAFAFYTGAWEQARPLLERAETGLLADEDRARAAESTMLLISIADRSGDTERAAVLTARMRASGPLPPLIQIFLDIGSAWQGIRLDDYATVDGAVTSSVDLLLASDDPAIWNVVPLAPPLALGPAGPTTLERYCHAAPRRFNDAPSLIRATAEQLSGYLHFLRGRLDEAAAATDRAQQLVEQLRGLADVEPGIDQIRFALALIRVGPIAAGQYIDRRLPEVGQNTILRMWLPGYRYLATKAHWLAGHADEARAMAEGLATGGPFPDLPIVSQAQALLAGLLAMSAGRYEEAERQLRAASAFRPPYYTVLFWLDHPQLLLALCYERWGRPREAMMTLRPVLEECERLDTPGIVLKVGPVVAPLLRLAVERGVHAAFAARTLHILEAAAPADPATASVTVPDTGETLSPREVEVLRLLADGASNATIADALFISPNTVKTHVARLLAKLGVASRTAAAARARDLGVG